MGIGRSLMVSESARNSSVLSIIFLLFLTSTMTARPIFAQDDENHNQRLLDQQRIEVPFGHLSVGRSIEDTPAYSGIVEPAAAIQRASNLHPGSGITATTQEGKRRPDSSEGTLSASEGRETSA